MLSAILGVLSFGGIISALYMVFRFCWKLAAPAALERESAPELNPRWKCQHTDLIEVDESATGEIVAYICTKCDEQVDFRDDSAVAYRQAQRISNGWADLRDGMEEDREVARAKLFAARTQLAEKLAGSPYVMVEPSLKGFKTEIRSWERVEPIRIDGSDQ